jgi:hypothetical protein
MNDALIQALERELGPGGVLTGEAAQEKAVSGWSRVGTPLAVLRPHCTQAVSAVLRLCNEANQPARRYPPRPVAFSRPPPKQRKRTTCCCRSILARAVRPCWAG